MSLIARLGNQGRRMVVAFGRPPARNALRPSETLRIFVPRREMGMERSPGSLPAGHRKLLYQFRSFRVGDPELSSPASTPWHGSGGDRGGSAREAGA
ncbi:hypothetical protein FTUN_2450 [Frigoriglobus tundricola]|uniref:Uncharacterized protein n=1 Tax=Frigoriglobus tundricola TaxID=2774151 RepID=A0A6M5YMX4_9BACT|nr:hypothetical protein FTUN_2450 [Frigoriglobus tundricola]